MCICVMLLTVCQSYSCGHVACYNPESITFNPKYYICKIYSEEKLAEHCLNPPANKKCSPFEAQKL